ncbi:MAG: hypothetical protein N2V78_04735 [Methanophagales archaeon]|nr:hypothetical protein [Methanophagales archaeon]
MAVRVRLKIKRGSGAKTIETSSLVNSGFEALKPLACYSATTCRGTWVTKTCEKVFGG